MKRFLDVILFFVATQTSFIVSANEIDKLIESSVFTITLDTSNRLPVSAIAQKRFISFNSFFNNNSNYLPTNITLWWKIKVENKTLNDTSFAYSAGFQNYIYAYKKTNLKYIEVGICGNLVPKSSLSLPFYRQAILLHLKANETAEFLFSIKNITTYHVDKFEPKLISFSDLSKSQESLFRKNIIPNYLFFIGIGMFFIMLLYILIKWIYQKDSTYFYYALSIFGCSSYFLFIFFETENNQYLSSESPIYILLLSDSFIFLSIFAYWGFVRKFLYIDKEKTFLNDFLFYGQIVVGIIGILSLMYALFTYNIMGLIDINSKAALVFLAAGSYVLYAIRNSNQPLRRFIYGGIFSIIFFSSLASIYEILRGTKHEFLPDFGGGTPFIMLGFIFEMLFFTTGLAYRNKLEINSLANIEIVKNEAELKAIRAQMNPHFIFNCMTTIDAYIFKEEPQKASAFLNKFSKLIRQTLHNSQFEFINFKAEIEALDLYIMLEQERFDFSFDYEINLPENINLVNFKIPPLIIQPYVENAILHGLRNKKDEKCWLKINLIDRSENILIEIIDNGVGREASQAQKNISGHNSLGTILTKLRLEKLPTVGKIEITDLEINTKTGTKVSIHIPKIEEI